MKYEDALPIFKRAEKIVDSDLSWSKKYDMIFSDEISAKFKLDYYDPDMDYEDDVRAFMKALEEHLAELKIIHDQIDN